jgi:16S rRNA (adenine1518-N6/adenine1519-N6)-dimethyltransferase
MSNSYDGFPPVSDFIRRHGVSALKSLGQNFILDMNLTDRIARSVPRITENAVVEIGSGPGALTRALLKNGARKVIAVEFDKRATGILYELQERYGEERLTIIQGDAMRVDYAEIAEREGGKISICANLPYNISVALLIDWLHMMDKISSMTLMFQKEVGQRIVAKPRSKDYSRLSILAQTVARPKILFEVARTNFVPPPQVTSCIVQLLAKPDMPDRETLSRLEEIVKAAFSERRKMLRTTLGFMGAEALESVGINPTQRAEEISPERFLKLAQGS